MFFKKRKNRHDADLNDEDPRTEDDEMEPEDDDVEEGTYPLIEALNLPEIVPSIILSDLQKDAKDRNGAVRRLNNLPEGVSGYTVLVLTEEALESAEFDPDDEAFGNLGMSLRGGVIQSATLAFDGSHGRIVIIPTEDTLAALDEYDELRNAVYRWGIFPIDITDEDVDARVTLLDQETTLAEVMDLVANDEDPQLGQPEEEDPESDQAETNEEAPDETVDTPNDTEVDADEDMAPSEKDGSAESEDLFSGVTSSDIGDEEADVPAESDEEEDAERPADSDESDDAEADEVLDLDPETEDDYDLAPEEEETSEASESDPKAFAQDLKGLSQELFQNHDLALAVRPDVFNDLFASDRPFQFDLVSEGKDGLLDHTLNEKRRLANARLNRLHQTHLQTLKQMFFDQMNASIQTITERLDDTNAETEVGQERRNIEDQHASEKDRAESVVLEYREQLKKDYEENQQNYAEQAAAQARREYDERHKTEFDQKSDQAEVKLSSQIDQNYAGRIHQLHRLRQTMAARLFDKAHADIISSLQTVYEGMMKKEAHLQHQITDDIQNYLHENYASDVMRREALAEKLRQTKKADEVRAAYEEKLNDNKQRIASLQEEADATLKDLKQRHKQYVDSLRLDYEAKLNDKKAELTALNRDMADLRKHYADLDDRTNDRYRSEIKRQKDTIDSQNELLHNQESKVQHMKRLSGGLLIAAVIAALVIGSFSTFLFTRDSGAVASAAGPVSVVAPDSNAAAASESDTDPVDGYVAKSKDNKSLIIKYAKSYAAGDQIPVISALDKQKSSSVEVTSVSGQTVTVKDQEGTIYTFHAID